MATMMRMAALIAGLLLAQLWAPFAKADHLTYLPLVPQTPLMQSIIQTQTVKWCVNATGQTYPNFVAQLEDVHRSYTEDVGIRFERVAWGSMASTGCQVQHNLTEFSCNGCAAHIFYANWPVVVEYKVSLGYTDWRSAFGHELGHGLLGLHEQYKDSGGTIGCTFRPDTVMSCGSPFVKYPQPRDVNLGCAIIATSWCAAQEPVVFPVWTGTCWNYGYWCYNPTTGVWTDPQGVPEWQPYHANGQEYNRRIGQWRWTGLTTWTSDGATWTCQSFCFGGQ